MVTLDFRNTKRLRTVDNLLFFQSLGIIQQQNWTEYQSVMLKLLLNPSQHVLHAVQDVLSPLPSPWFAVSAHVRCAGKLADYKERTQMVTERQLVFVSNVIKYEFKGNHTNSNQAVFLATDSEHALNKLTSLLKPIQVISNQHIHRGHSTLANQEVVESSMIDLFLLTRSEILVGVNRSGFSRVAGSLFYPKRIKWIYA